MLMTTQVTDAMVEAALRAWFNKGQAAKYNTSMRAALEAALAVADKWTGQCSQCATQFQPIEKLLTEIEGKILTTRECMFQSTPDHKGEFALALADLSSSMAQLLHVAGTLVKSWSNKT